MSKQGRLGELGKWVKQNYGTESGLLWRFWQCGRMFFTPHRKHSIYLRRGRQSDKERGDSASVQQRRRVVLDGVNFERVRDSSYRTDNVPVRQPLRQDGRLSTRRPAPTIDVLYCQKAHHLHEL